MILAHDRMARVGQQTELGAMLSKPIASGMMLTAIVLLGGGALLQSDSGSDDARTATITAAPEIDTSPEREASAPSRVVDSAGFQLVPEGQREDATATGPTVTVNGRPINGERPAPTAQPAPEAVAATEPQPGGPDPNDVAVAEPPRPIPRPEGLVGPGRETLIDYDAIAALAYERDEAFEPRSVVQDTGEFMSLEQRQRLAPVPADEPISRFDPRRDGLVAVVGPDGEPIWIYEEQVRGNAATNSGVTFQRRQVQSNPYGFVYDEYGW